MGSRDGFFFGRYSRLVHLVTCNRPTFNRSDCFRCDDQMIEGDQTSDARRMQGLHLETPDNSIARTCDTGYSTQNLFLLPQV